MYDSLVYKLNSIDNICGGYVYYHKNIILTRPSFSLKKNVRHLQIEVNVANKRFKSKKCENF